MSIALTEFPLPTLAEKQLEIQKSLMTTTANHQGWQNLALFAGFTVTLVVILSITTFVLWLVSFVDVLSGEFKNPNDKLVWLLAIILVPLLGSLVYLFIGRKSKIAVKTTSRKTKKK